MNSIYEDNEWLAIRANSQENVNMMNSIVNCPYGDDFEIDEDPFCYTSVLVHSKKDNKNYEFFIGNMTLQDDEYCDTEEECSWYSIKETDWKKRFSAGIVEFLYSCGLRPSETISERMKYIHCFENGKYAFAYCFGDITNLASLQIPNHWTSLEDMFHEAKLKGDSIDLSGWDVRNIIDFSKIFYLSTFKKIVLDDWCIDSHVTNFKDMFNGYTLKELSLRNWQLSSAIDENYNLEDVDDYFMSNGYVIQTDRDINDSLTIDISGCDKHTATCLLSRFMYGYNWDIKFVIDEQSEVKEMYESFIQLILENDQFSLSDRTSKRRKEYLSKLYEFPFFRTADVDEMDFACDGYWKKYLDVEDWRIQTCFRKDIN